MIGKQILISDLNIKGGGIGRFIDDEGQVVFVDGALQGEIVECSRFWRRKNTLHGELSKIIKTSPHRVEAKCKHFGVCGGCSLQHLDHAQQVVYKQNHIVETVRRIGKIEEIDSETIEKPICADSGDEWFYRRKARLSIRYITKKDRVLIGFYERGGRKIADIQSCPILAKPVDNLLTPISELLITFSTREKIAQLEIAIAEKLVDGKAIPQAILIFRNLTQLPADEVDSLKKIAKENDCIVYLQPDSKTLQQIYPSAVDEKKLNNNYYLPKWDITLQFSPADFMQVNAKVNALLIARAIELLDIQSGDKIADLFCGLGNFSLPMAKVGKSINVEVIGIEGEANLIATAKKNAKLNDLNNCEFLVDDLFNPSAQTLTCLFKVNKIIIDPPRLGALAVCENIPANINRIVYVSCHPATLARDGEILQKHNFKLAKLGMVDMFPHTNHAEAISLWTR